MRIFLLTLLIACRCLTESLQAQVRISIDAPDSLAFLLTINEVAVNSYPVVSLELNVSTSGKTNLKAEFPERPTLNFSQVVNIKKGAAVAYSIERSKGALKFILTSESLQAVNMQSPIETTPALIQSDTLIQEAAHNGCFPLSDDQAYQDMHAAVDAQHFEAKKLNLMAEFAGKSCVRTDQLRYMMSKLSQEDNKLALLVAARDHIYDPERLKEVTADFFLARNKVKADEIVDQER
ncbi:MAG: DUF4476 domain-containing protein [Flavobacteriales bacterium]|jgi:hypothetical protein